MEIPSHSRQLVGCQIPNLFSRIAGLLPRVCTASRKLLATVSATVSTAGWAMLAPSSIASHSAARWPRSILQNLKPYLTPSFLLFPAPLTARAGLFRSQIKFLNVLRMHQPLAGIVHH